MARRKAFAGSPAESDYHNRFGLQAVQRGYAVLAPLNINSGKKRSWLDRKGIMAGQRLQALEQVKLMRAVDYLSGRREVDPNQIGAYGISWGGQVHLAVQDALQGCPSGRMVSHILLRDKGAADAAYEQIKKGADFATVAKSVSIDPSGKEGGVLGCLCPGEFVKEFQTVADKVPLDVVTVPVQSKFGYHLILVQKFDPTLAQTNQSVAQSVQTCAQGAITDRLKHVTVDPRFGTWDAQNFTVVPPAVPEPRNNRGSTTTTTAPAAAVAPQG